MAKKLYLIKGRISSIKVNVKEEIKIKIIGTSNFVIDTNDIDKLPNNKYNIFIKLRSGNEKLEIVTECQDIDFSVDTQLLNLIYSLYKDQQVGSFYIYLKNKRRVKKLFFD